MTTIAKFFLSERRFLVLMLVASLGAHGAAFYVFAVTDTVKITGLGARPRVGWMRPAGLGKPGEMALQYVIAEALDPSLMSLPSARGFSSKMWERGVAATHRRAEWYVRPAFLDIKVPDTIPVLLPRAPLVELVQSSVQPFAAETEEPTETPEPPVVVNQSVFRVVGPLQERAVVWAPVLPTVTSANPLRPTRIRVGVSGDGVVRYVTLERSGGDETVDARALELVRQIRFELLRDPDSRALTWGVVRFLWATEPPAVSDKSGGGTQP